MGVYFFPFGEGKGDDLFVTLDSLPAGKALLVTESYYENASEGSYGATAKIQMVTPAFRSETVLELGEDEGNQYVFQGIEGISPNITNAQQLKDQLTSEMKLQLPGYAGIDFHEDEVEWECVKENFTLTPEGVKVTVNHLSPFALGYQQPPAASGSVPRTGDSTPIALYAALCAMSLCAAVLVMKRKKA